MTSTASATAGSKKLGQPLPDSNFVSVLNSAAPQPAQWNMPSPSTWRYGLGPGRSVPCSRRMWYCSGVSSSRHSASDFWILFVMYPLGFLDWDRRDRLWRRGPAHRRDCSARRAGRDPDPELAACPSPPTDGS